MPSGHNRMKWEVNKDIFFCCLFICAYNVWVISSPYPPLPPFPPTPSFSKDILREI
jgi:hypothetical protein